MTDALRQGGPVLGLIFALSLLAWTLIVAKYLYLRRLEREPGWWPEALARARAGDAEGARRLADDREDTLAIVLTAALGIRRPTPKTFKKTVSPVLEDLAVDLKKHVPLIAALGAAAPLLGLLGTVAGMIKTFGALSLGIATEASPLADGVSQALLTTQAGLVVALPIVLAYRVLSSRVERHVDAIRANINRLEAALCRGGG